MSMAVMFLMGFLILVSFFVRSGVLAIMIVFCGFQIALNDMLPFYLNWVGVLGIVFGILKSISIWGNDG